MRGTAFQFLVFLALGAAATPALAAKKEFHICYFSLNKEDEFEVTKTFMDKLNADSYVKINVTEFQPDKDTAANPKDAIPNAAFRKMVESGARCDGLVISGHHTGSYGGKRAYNKNRLELDFMEALSCNPKYAEFFKNVNAVWLQGCRTLGVGAIVAGQENDDRYNANFHTNRVGAVLEEDQLGQNMAQLNNEFSNTLDQDNPLSSRYLRLFPAAKLFGWTQTAPGEKANSQYSILFHIAHMAKILDATGDYPKESPLSPALSPDSVARYVNGVLLALARFTPEEQQCEELATAAWIEHGRRKNAADRYSFDNADLAALTSLAGSGNENLKVVKQLECKLKAAGDGYDPAPLNAVLDALTAKPELLPYSFNSLVDLRNRLLRAAAVDKTDEGKRKKAQMAQTILDRMRTHPTVTGFLESKIASRQLGVLRKIDYYKFYTALTSNVSPAVQAEIEARVLEELAKPLPRTSQTSRNLARDYRKTLLESGFKNRIFSPQIVDSVLALNPEYDVLESLALLVGYAPVKDKFALLDRLGSYPQANKYVGSAVAFGALGLLGPAAPKGAPDPRANDPRYVALRDKHWSRLAKTDDYWHGELHNDDGTTTPATPVASIPAPGAPGGPPGPAGSPGTGYLAGPTPLRPVGGATAAAAPPAGFDPLGDFFRRIFQ